MGVIVFFCRMGSSIYVTGRSFVYREVVFILLVVGRIKVSYKFGGEVLGCVYLLCGFEYVFFVFGFERY